MQRRGAGAAVGIPLAEVPVVCGCVVSVSNKAEQTRQLGQHIQYIHTHGLRTPNEAFFHRNPKLFGLGQTIWAEIFCAIWGILGRFVSTHFGTVSPLSMFFIKSTIIFTKKTKPLYLNPEICLGLGLVI